MDEETQKRNTDCVYFLASPLTCKKGNECEYRHSESARVNPRDCWFWLGGNCLNPACSFRHPPLDGLSGAPSSGLPGASSGLPGAPSSAPSQLPTTQSLPAPGNANKPKVPCYFFNQGFCAKGDKCPYIHGTFSGGSLATQKTTKVSTTAMDPQASGKQAMNEAENIRDGKRPSPGVANANLSSNPKKVQSINSISTMSNNFKAVQSSNPVALQSNNLKAGKLGNSVAVHSNHVKAVQVPPAVKSVSQVRSQPAHTLSNRHNGDSDLPEIESTREIVHDAPVSRSRMRHVQLPDDRLQNGMDHDEWLGESSPGFDVLVDNGPDQLSHHEDADYFSNHDIELGRGTSNGRERNKKREYSRFDYDHPSMHERAGYSDGEFQYDHGAYDQYKHRGYDHVGRKQLNTFDDRASERSIVRGRRSLSIEDDVERNNVGDLRHHISKRRKFGSAKALDNSTKRQHVDTQHGDFHHGHRLWDDEHRHHDVTYRDHSQGRSHSNRRLHGRIQVETGGFKLESFDNAESDYEGNSERFRSKSSPGRRVRSDHFRSNYQGKERGRMLADASALSESSGSRSKNFKNNETRTDVINFAGPKTLAQIKEEKNREKSEEPTSSILSRLHGSVQNVSIKSEARLVQNLPLEESKMKSGKVTHDLGEEQAFEGPKPLSDILKAKRRGGQGNDDITGERPVEDPNEYYQSFSSGMNTTSAEKANVSPLSEKEVEEGELPEGDDYAFEPSVMSRRAEDVEAFGVDALMEHKPSAPANGAVPVERNGLDDTVMNEDIHSNGEEDIDADHEDYDLEHSEHEENEEWQRNGNQMQEDEEETYIEDDDDDDFAKKLGGIFS